MTILNYIIDLYIYIAASVRLSMTKYMNDDPSVGVVLSCLKMS